MDAQTESKLLCCTACGVEAQLTFPCNCGTSYDYLSSAERIEIRRKKAAELYKDGLTQAQIAERLKMAQSVISDDLGDLSETDKSKRSKTAINPKGAGRPKGSKSKTRKSKREPKPPGVKQAQRSIDLLPEVWEQVKARAAAGNMAVAEFIGQLLTITIDPTIDPKTLSKTGQDKLAAAIRQHRKQLDREFEPRVQAEYTARVQKQFPELEKMERDARDEKRLYERLRRETKTPMTMAEYTLVCSLLHPDSRESASKERLMRAFQMFEPKVFALTGEKKKYKA